MDSSGRSGVRKNYQSRDERRDVNLRYRLADVCERTARDLSPPGRLLTPAAGDQRQPELTTGRNVGSA